MRSHNYVLPFVAFAMAGVQAQTVPSTPQFRGGDCSSLVVNHSYSQRFEGFLNMGGLVPSAGAGFVTFLPHGKMAGQVTLAIGQMAVNQDIVFDSNASTYSLSWDTTKTPAVCSGTTTQIAPGESPFDFQLIVTEDGQQIEMIHTDAGLIVGATGFPVPVAHCSNASLNGTYSYNMKGWGLASPAQGFPPEQLLAGYYPFAFSGAMEFHPRATSNSSVWWDTGSVNGTITTRAGTGTYKVNSNCTGTMLLPTGSPSRQAFNLELFVGKNGTLYVVNVDTDPIMGVPAFVLSGTLNRTGEE